MNNLGHQKSHVPRFAEAVGSTLPGVCQVLQQNGGFGFICDFLLQATQSGDGIEQTTDAGSGDGVEALLELLSKEGKPFSGGLNASQSWVPGYIGSPEVS